MVGLALIQHFTAEEALFPDFGGQVTVVPATVIKPIHDVEGSLDVISRLGSFLPSRLPFSYLQAQVEFYRQG